MVMCLQIVQLGQQICLSIIVDQLYINRCSEQQLKGCSVQCLTILGEASPLFSWTQTLEYEAHVLFVKFHIKEHPEFALLKLSPHCPFQNNLMACNKKCQYCYLLRT